MPLHTALIYLVQKETFILLWFGGHLIDKKTSTVQECIFFFLMWKEKKKLTALTQTMVNKRKGSLSYDSLTPQMSIVKGLVTFKEENNF